MEETTKVKDWLTWIFKHPIKTLFESMLHTYQKIFRISFFFMLCRHVGHCFFFAVAMLMHSKQNTCPHFNDAGLVNFSQQIEHVLPSQSFSAFRFPCDTACGFSSGLRRAFSNTTEFAKLILIHPKVTMFHNFSYNWSVTAAHNLSPLYHSFNFCSGTSNRLQILAMLSGLIAGSLLLIARENFCSSYRVILYFSRSLALLKERGADDVRGELGAESVRSTISGMSRGERWGRPSIKKSDSYYRPPKNSQTKSK